MVQSIGPRPFLSTSGCNACWLRRACCYPRVDTNVDPYAYSHANTNPNSWSNTYPYAHPNAYTPSDSNTV